MPVSQRNAQRNAQRGVQRNPIGSHVPVAGGLATRGISYARSMGAEAVQVFVGNPRGWATPPGDPGQDELFRAACAERGLAAFVHAPYLINLGSHDAVTARRSVDSLRHALRRGRELGARGVVVHTGQATGGRPTQVALAQVRRLLLPLLSELTRDRRNPWLLLEPTAGQGASLCSRAADLGPYLAALDHHPRVGVCLDTCHAFAAGHDLASPGGTAALLDELVAVAGPGRLRLIHVNDSKDAVGSRRDRHANIAEGSIGAAGLAALFGHPATEGVPLVLETPERGIRADVAALRKLREAHGPHSSGPSPGSS
ncbi:deoxyribonuclease IV [Streptomyces sp. 6N223]|uniref:deoxyribonuclease IV n=1 Tax=Streptomyces sp. 6N223 TaxID=3457412 RepID=UPI003FD3F742